VGSGIKLDDLPASEEEFIEASLFDLITAFTKVLKDIPKEAFHKVIKDEFTVSEKIHDILHLICDRKTVFFTELFKAARNKFEVINIFLAILELIKIREIVVRQVAPFGDIEIIRNTETIKPSGEVNG
jgi:segregation and condensation protein A